MQKLKSEYQEYNHEVQLDLKLVEDLTPPLMEGRITENVEKNKSKFKLKGRGRRRGKGKRGNMKMLSPTPTKIRN